MVQLMQKARGSNTSYSWASGAPESCSAASTAEHLASFFNQRPWINQSVTHLVPRNADVWTVSLALECGGFMSVPVQVAREKLYGIACTVVRPVGDPMSDRFELGLSDEKWGEFFSALFGAPFDWDVAVFGETTFTEQLKSRLDAEVRERGATSEFRLTGRTPQIDLTKIDPNNAAATYAKKIRARLRRNNRRVAESGGVEYQFVDAAENTGALFDRIAKIEAQSWKAETGSTVFGNETLRCFLTGVAQDSLASMTSLASFAKVGGVDAAYLFSFVSDDRLLDYQGGYDTRFANLSVGVLLTQALIQHCASRGVSVFDASRSSINHVPIQTIFPHTMREHHRFFIYNKTLSGRALSLASRTIRPRAKSVAQRLQQLTSRRNDP